MLARISTVPRTTDHKPAALTLIGAGHLSRPDTSLLPCTWSEVLNLLACVQRNYRFFMAFLIVTTVLDALVHAFCWVRLVYITQHDDQPGFGEAIKREPAAIALIAYSFFAFG